MHTLKRPLILCLYFLPAIIFFAASWHAYQHEILSCTRCDSSTYLLMGADYDQRGWLVDTVVSKVRLYGFGIFLASLIRLSRHVPLTLNTLAYLAQAGLYLGAAGWLAAIVRRNTSAKAGALVFAALALNILAYPYFGVLLTDGFSLGLELLIIALLAELYLNRRLMAMPWQFALACLALGLVFGFAVMVRPANIQFAGFIALALLASVAVNPEKRWVRLPVLLLALAGFGLAVWPQYQANMHYYHAATIFPASDLGAYQLHAGRAMLKYGTLGTGEGNSIIYTSPWWLEGNHGDNDLRWYTANHWLGLKTIFCHVFGGLDFDEYYPFARSLHAKGLIWLALLSQLILYWGIVGGAKGAWQAWHAVRARDFVAVRRWGFVLVLSTAIVASWLAVYALTAVENRFALPLITLAMPWAFYGLWPRRRWNYAALWVGFALWFYFAWQVVLFLDSIKTLPPL
jgi:hypothetical protein